VLFSLRLENSFEIAQASCAVIRYHESMRVNFNDYILVYCQIQELVFDVKYFFSLMVSVFFM